MCVFGGGAHDSRLWRGRPSLIYAPEAAPESRHAAHEPAPASAAAAAAPVAPGGGGGSGGGAGGEGGAAATLIWGQVSPLAAMRKPTV